MDPAHLNLCWQKPAAARHLLIHVLHVTKRQSAGEGQITWR